MQQQSLKDKTLKTQFPPLEIPPKNIITLNYAVEVD